MERNGCCKGGQGDGWMRERERQIGRWGGIKERERERGSGTG